MTKIRSHKNRAINLQKFIAQEISRLTKLPFGWDLDIQSRQMGQRGTDIILSEKARQEFPFGVECKSTKKFHYQYIRDAMEYNGCGLKWLLFWKKTSLPFSKTISLFSYNTFECFCSFGLNEYINKRNNINSKRWSIEKWIDFKDPTFFLIATRETHPICIMFAKTLFLFMEGEIYNDKKNNDRKFPWVES